MNLTHAIALFLAVAGPFVLILGLEFLLGIARYVERLASENPASGALDSTDSRFRRNPVALPGVRN